MNSYMMTTSSLLIILTLLTMPILSYMYPTPFSIQWSPFYIKNMVKMTFFISLLPLFLFINEGTETIIASWSWMQMLNFNINISFKFDLYSIIFTSVALYITWSILEFTTYYMHSDLNANKFSFYLLTFLIAMLTLVTANNMLQLFVGWEGVGIMSFLLISWWYGRTNANTAALQAVLYNRVGDIGLLVFMMSIAMNVGSWEIQEIFILSKEKDITLPLLGLVLAAAGKSAQFGLHPWLPSAMEGPTPVSALLHSSTMVVAGIFLMIRTAPLMQDNQQVSTLCLCLGALTTLFNAICALTQNDMKKIVAFSTASQLGLMMVAIGLNQPQLAFMHICTHAFFKAMLFLCSGSVIHSLNDEQDIRKMGGMHQLTPLTSSSLTLGSLALMGTPYLTGFFSKDPIIEAMNTSYLNAWALMLTILATSFTAIYSLRVIYYVNMNYPRFNSLPMINENNNSLVNSIKRLAWGTIFSGLIISFNMINQKPPILTMPFSIKLAALVVTVIGALTATKMVSIISEHKVMMPKQVPYKFSNMLGFYPLMMHLLLPQTSLEYGQKIATKMIDMTWLKKVGPNAMINLNMPLITNTSNIQKGLIKTFFMLFMLTIILTMLMVY